MERLVVGSGWPIHRRRVHVNHRAFHNGWDYPRAHGPLLAALPDRCLHGTIARRVPSGPGMGVGTSLPIPPFMDEIA
jgi:hypothetical protein